MATMNRQQRRKQQKLDRAGKKGPLRAPAVATEIGGTAPFQMGGAAPSPLAGGPGARCRRGLPPWPRPRDRQDV